MSAKVITRWWNNVPDTEPRSADVIPLRKPKAIQELFDELGAAQQAQKQTHMNAAEAAQTFENACKEIVDEYRQLYSEHQSVMQQLAETYAANCKTVADIQSQIVAINVNNGIPSQVPAPYPLDVSKIELKIEIVERKP